MSVSGMPVIASSTACCTAKNPLSKYSGTPKQREERDVIRDHDDDTSEEMLRGGERSKNR